MNWLYFCLLTIILYSIHDITLKHLAGAIPSTLASICINGSAAILLFIYWIFQSGSGKTASIHSIWSLNLLWLVLAGLSLGVATITFMNAFAGDGKLSVAVPIVYAGVMLLCLMVGLVFYQEVLSWKQWVGAILAIAGICLMSTT
jgi:uncharacterized membrane protein